MTRPREKAYKTPASRMATKSQKKAAVTAREPTNILIKPPGFGVNPATTLRLQVGFVNP